jgi:hypothetical protein
MSVLLFELIPGNRYAAIYHSTSFPVVRRQRSHLVYVCLELVLRGRLRLT